MDALKAVMLQQEVSSLNRARTYVNTAIRNAITSLEDGDFEQAVDILKSIIGD